MHSSSTPVYWVIFKSTFQPLRSLHFLSKIIKRVIPDIILLSESCLSPFSHSSLTIPASSFHCFRSEVILYSYLLSAFPPSVLFSLSLSFFWFGLSIYELWAFFKLSLLEFLGVSLSFHVCRPLHPLCGQQMENQCVCSTVSLLESNMLREGLSLSLSALLHFSSLISV